MTVFYSNNAMGAMGAMLIKSRLKYFIFKELDMSSIGDLIIDSRLTFESAIELLI